MSALLILLIGTVVVLAGILILRLHAFITLLLASIVVALLTPDASRYAVELQQYEIEVRSVNPTAGEVILDVGEEGGLVEGNTLIWVRSDPETGPYLEQREVRVRSVSDEGAVVFIDEDDEAFFEAGDVILTTASEEAARSAAGQSIGQHIASGFGRTAGGIGILIAMAAIIGKCLLDSGAAKRIVNAVSTTLGLRRTPFAFLFSGFFLGIPVFFDTVFYLMIPLAKAMFLRTKEKYLLYVLAIVAGGTMAHSLVPPTPGPLFVASELGIDLGLMILGGMCVGSIAAGSGFVYARWADATWPITLRPSTDGYDDTDDLIHRTTRQMEPPLFWATLPVLLPVVLIAGNSVFGLLYDPGALTGLYRHAAVLVGFLGDKNIALILSAIIALGLLFRYQTDRSRFGSSVQEALQSGAVIVLITSAGGAFGYVLRQTNIAAEIQHTLPGAEGALLWIAFGMTMLVRIAQGSATVAMITAVGIVAPIAAVAELGYHPLYLALAIGCGSKPVSWMNDSGFWIIGKMSGLTEQETLKTASVLIALMGFVGFAATLLGAWLFPLV